MENKIIFLIVAILLIALMFSKKGTELIKKAVGVVKETSTTHTSESGNTHGGGGRSFDKEVSQAVNDGARNG